MDIKKFVKKTMEDTIGFFQVWIRSLESLRDRTESEERAKGVQDAIDLANEWCDTGKNVQDLYVAKRMELLQKGMQTEAEEAGLPAVEACGPESDKKLN